MRGQWRVLRGRHCLLQLLGKLRLGKGSINKMKQLYICHFLAQRKVFKALRILLTFYCWPFPWTPCPRPHWHWCWGCQCPPCCHTRTRSQSPGAAPGGSSCCPCRPGPPLLFRCSCPQVSASGLSWCYWHHRVPSSGPRAVSWGADHFITRVIPEHQKYLRCEISIWSGAWPDYDNCDADAGSMWWQRNGIYNSTGSQFHKCGLNSSARESN